MPGLIYSRFLIPLNISFAESEEGNPSGPQQTKLQINLVHVGFILCIKAQRINIIKSRFVKFSYLLIIPLKAKEKTSKKLQY